jgi:gluconate 2-dehydrogenase gamma chain
MNRREAIQLLAAGVAIPLVPGNVPGKMMALLREARAVAGTPPASHTLNAHQYATVKTMAEMIIPRTDTPGAADVGAAEFIDLILTEWSDEKERNRFLSGLADVDARSQSLFSKDFVSSSSTQQADILIALGEKLFEETPPGARAQRRQGDWASRPNESFYFMLRRLTLTAYYTSEAGATGELHFQIIPETHSGCADEKTVKEVSERR